MSLTDEQKASLWQGSCPRLGLQIVSARPGTGKTYTLARYVADMMENWDESHRSWQGIALLSYTNVAKDELKGTIAGLGHSLAIDNYPNFTGTIDSFINQFIFLPHGAPQMAATGRPKLVGEPFAPWISPRNLEVERLFDGFSFKLDGTTDFDAGKLALNYQRNAATLARDQARIESAKNSLNRRRYATQADANHFAFQVLRRIPRLARCLALRFPVLVIDEAQDMTETQHAIIDSLIRSGLPNAVLIGDEYQAIYEWNTAEPKLFVEKIGSPDWQYASISGSFRCSQNICITLNALTSPNSINPAEGSRNAAYTEPVSVQTFDSSSVNAGEELVSLVDRLAFLLQDKEPHAGDGKSVRIGILSRGKDDAAHLRNLYTSGSRNKRPSVTFEDKRAKLFLTMCFQAVSGFFGRAFKAYERLIFASDSSETLEEMREKLAVAWCGEGARLLDYRREIVRAIRRVTDNLLPSAKAASLTISSCAPICELDLPGLESAATSIKAELQKFAPTPRRRGAAVVDHDLSDLFLNEDPKLSVTHANHPNIEIVFSTIHGVKGETYDGVLFVIRTQGSSCGCPSSSNRNLTIAGHDALLCESKRLMYVAASRAAQCLWIAVQSKESEWHRLFQA